MLEPPPFRRAVAAFDYAPPWDGLIARYKFDSALDLAPALSAALLAAVRRSATEMAQLILPVPLSPARLRERGFNQSWEIARRLGAPLRCRVDAQMLLRTKETAHQIALPTQQRLTNVRGAFAVEPLRVSELEGRNVALVDDVMTTGATFAELARTLLQAGAAQVQVWALARTPAPER